MHYDANRTRRRKASNADTSTSSSAVSPRGMPNSRTTSSSSNPLPLRTAPSMRSDTSSSSSVPRRQPYVSTATSSISSSSSTSTTATTSASITDSSGPLPIRSSSSREHEDHEAPRVWQERNHPPVVLATEQHAPFAHNSLGANADVNMDEQEYMTHVQRESTQNFSEQEMSSYLDVLLQDEDVSSGGHHPSGFSPYNSSARHTQYSIVPNSHLSDASMSPDPSRRQTSGPSPASAEFPAAPGAVASAASGPPTVPPSSTSSSSSASSSSSVSSSLSPLSYHPQHHRQNSAGSGFKRPRSWAQPAMILPSFGGISVVSDCAARSESPCLRRDTKPSPQSLSGPGSASFYEWSPREGGQDSQFPPFSPLQQQGQHRSQQGFYGAYEGSNQGFHEHDMYGGQLDGIAQQRHAQYSPYASSTLGTSPTGQFRGNPYHRQPDMGSTYATVAASGTGPRHFEQQHQQQQQQQQQQPTPSYGFPTYSTVQDQRRMGSAAVNTMGNNSSRAISGGLSARIMGGASAPDMLARDPSSTGGDESDGGVGGKPGPDEGKYRKGKWDIEEEILLLHVVYCFLDRELKDIAVIAFDCGISRSSRAIDKKLKRVVPFEKWKKRDISQMQDRLAAVLHTRGWMELDPSGRTMIQRARDRARARGESSYEPAYTKNK
mmetsp:Transcript_5148/g.10663  ORF Transcript_5148/g.10663 Transcript_5148/m.10663 type:complete len:662 (-) Transcript_5148:435-2420(-)